MLLTKIKIKCFNKNDLIIGSRVIYICLVLLTWNAIAAFSDVIASSCSRVMRFLGMLSGADLAGSRGCFSTPLTLDK